MSGFLYTILLSIFYLYILLLLVLNIIRAIRSGMVIYHIMTREIHQGSFYEICKKIAFPQEMKQ